MYIEELKEGELESVEEQAYGDSNKGAIVIWDAKKALVGAGGRALFYPTLLYNVVRNKVQPEFHWWDRVDECFLRCTDGGPTGDLEWVEVETFIRDKSDTKGAVPFPADVPRLKALGVSGVVTLNEPFETLVPTSLYHDYNIAHLVIPTRDYLFAPAYGDICLAVDFIHDNASCGKTTYVHCKAGRGRSTTIVLCYLVKYRGMTPEAAYDHVRSIRPRVLLANSQRQAVLDYYFHVKKGESKPGLNHSVRKALTFPANEDSAAFEDGSMVVVTESDLDGYNETHEPSAGDKNRLSELNLACRFQFASQAAISRISCLWPRYQANGKVSRKKLGNSMGSSELEWVGVDIHVY